MFEKEIKYVLAGFHMRGIIGNPAISQMRWYCILSHLPGWFPHTWYYRESCNVSNALVLHTASFAWQFLGSPSAIQLCESRPFVHEPSRGLWGTSKALGWNAASRQSFT